jgi:hypothetical protein
MRFLSLAILLSHLCVEFEIKDITDTTRPASYLDLNLEIDREGRLRTKPYDKRDDFNFHFPFICYNIPAAPAYVIYISQLIRYSRVCASYRDLLDRERELLLTILVEFVLCDLLVFCVVFSWSLFVILSLFVWPL